MAVTAEESCCKHAMAQAFGFVLKLCIFTAVETEVNTTTSIAQKCERAAKHMLDIHYVEVDGMGCMDRKELNR